MSTEWVIVTNKRSSKRIQERVNSSSSSSEKSIKKTRGGIRLRERRERRERRENALHNLVKTAFENAMAFDIFSLAPPTLL